MIWVLDNLKQTKALPVPPLLSLLPSPDTRHPQVRLSLCSTLDCWDYGERSASSHHPSMDGGNNRGLLGGAWRTVLPEMQP